MKKIIISGCILSCLFFLATISQAKSKVVKTYAFGFAASFNDSIIHFTDIQELDSTWLDDKDFLESRENYSYQLRDYLADRGMEHRTCIICYSSKLKKTKKKFTKMMDSYSKNGKYDSTQNKQFYRFNVHTYIEDIPKSFKHPKNGHEHKSKKRKDR